MTDARQIASRYFEAWQARDEQALRSVLAPDVDFSGPLGTAEGADEAVTGLLAMARTLERVHVTRMMTDGEDVMTWFDLHTSGAPATPVVNWSQVRDGRIATIRVTFDPRGILAARQAQPAGEDSMGAPAGPSPAGTATVHPRPAEPEIPLAAGAGITVLADRHRTGRAYSLYRWTLAASSRGPSAHWHAGFDELFIVESGEMTFDDGRIRTVLGPGDTAWAPRGALHGLRKEPGHPASVLMLLSPGIAREDYFRELVERGDSLDDAGMAELQRRHDNHGTL